LKRITPTTHHALVLALLLAPSCSAPQQATSAQLAGPAASVSPASSVPLAAHEPRSVTLRFVNNTGGDVFIDVTHGLALSIRDDERELTRPRSCMHACGDGCICKQCHPSPSLVRVIRAGEAFDVEWLGDHVVPGRCNGEAVCDCGEARQASAGKYEFSLRGSRAIRPARATAAGDDPSILAAALDTSARGCIAKGILSLGEGQSTYEVSFTCAKR